MSTPDEVHLICYTDGSSAPNPGFGGYGLFGYTYRRSTRSKNIRHPIYNEYFFTKTGIEKQKDAEELEILKIYEVIKPINKAQSTNNEAELLGFIEAFHIASKIPNLKSISIYTDSNYIVTAFNENMDKWRENNWKRQDNKQIVHISEWYKIDQYRQTFNISAIDINVNWVKGHSGNFCNDIADTYSTVGSQSSKNQILSKQENFRETILNSEMSYADFKKSFTNKDLMMFFRELYFSSNSIDDTNYCFLSTSETPNLVGKRDTASIFAVNVGYTPPVINSIKKLFRSVSRNYTAICCIKLSKLEDKEIYRLINLVDIEDLVTPTYVNSKLSYTLIGDSGPFIFENGIDYPFIVNTSKLYNRMLDLNQETENELITSVDITQDIVKDKKIAFTNKDKHLDFTDKLKDKIKFTQKLHVIIGYDIPNYLALKNIEEEIEKVTLLVERRRDSNFCTLYIRIQTSNRVMYSVNIENKYLCIS